MAIVEMVNEDAIYVGWTSSSVQPGTHRSLQRLAEEQSNAGTIGEASRGRRCCEPADASPRGRAVRDPPKEQYYTECEFFTQLESGFFGDAAYLREI